MRVFEEPLKQAVWWDSYYDHDRIGTIIGVCTDKGDPIWEKKLYSTWGHGRHAVPWFTLRRRIALRKAHRMAEAEDDLPRT